MSIELRVRYFFVLTGGELRKLVPNFQPHPLPGKPLIQQVYFTNFSAFSVN